MTYTFKNKVYEDLFLLGKDIYLNQVDFVYDLRNNKDLLEFIKNNDENKYLRILKLLKLSLPDDIIAFRASMILNPYMEFRYKGKLFKTYKDLGLYMISFAPETDSWGLELIHYNLLSIHALFSHFTYCTKEDFENIKEFEKAAELNISYSYFLLAYFLSQKKTLIYYKNEYEDIFSFLYFLKKENDTSNVSILLAHREYLKAFSKFSKDSKIIEEFLHYNSELHKSEEKLNSFLKKREESLNRISKFNK